MRRAWILIFLLLLACNTLALPFRPVATPLIPTSSPTATQIFLPVPSATPVPPAKTPLGQDFLVRTHPDGGIYVGDQVSFEVIAPPANQAQEVSAQVRQGYREYKDLGHVQFAPFGILGRLEATLTWAWDTRDLEAGDYEVIFTTHPQGQAWRETVTLQPRANLDAVEKQAAWASARSECCTIFYLTHTEAERDLPNLIKTVDLSAEKAASRMGVQVSEPITITFLSRVLGHGGFADSSIHISYLDRNYVGGNLEMILQHEITHVLDYRLGGDLRPSLLVEGLAVYTTGGHFKPEPLLPRAAALLLGEEQPDRPKYIPLETLADSFYTSQHEIGYLEGGALVEYMIQRWGWVAYSEFYRDIHQDSSGLPSRALDTALTKHFNLSLAQLEGAFRDALRKQVIPPGMADDLRLGVALYDTARRYQQVLDPSAYFLTPWLLDTRQMQSKGIVADYLRHPATPDNLAVETMLEQAGDELFAGKFSQTERLLGAVNAVLQAIEQEIPDPFQKDPLALEYAQVVLFLKDQWLLVQPSSKGPLQPQRIQIEGNMALAWFRTQDAILQEVSLIKDAGGWRLP